MPGKKYFLFIVFIFIVSSFLNSSSTEHAFCEENPQQPIRVILIGWDGVQRNRLIDILKDERVLNKNRRALTSDGRDANEAIPLEEPPLPAQDFLPALKEIIRQGSIVKINITENTATKAGWAQILTGYNADVTGVYSNGFFKAIPEGYSIFSRLHNKFGSNKPKPEDSVFNLMVTGKDIHIGTRGPENQVNPPEPFYIEKHYIDYRHTDKQRPNKEVYKLAKEGLTHYAASHQNEHLLAFIHFHQPDRWGHIYGEDSPEYRKGIELDDYYTGKLIDTLKELGIYENTLIYIVSDHGFDRTDARYPNLHEEDNPIYKRGHNHSISPYVFLATNDTEVVRDGNRRDIAPTIMEKFGIDLGLISPKLSGSLLTDRNFPEGVTPTEPDDALELKPVNKIFLISWAGANRVRVKEMLAKGKLNNLKALISEGRLVDIDITQLNGRNSVEPVTGLGVLVSGLDIETTGIYNNNRVDAPLPAGYTIFEQLKAHFSKKDKNILTALLIEKIDCYGGNQNTDSNIDKIFLNAKDDIDIYGPHIPLNTAFQPSSGLYPKITNKSDNKLFAFIQMSNIDTVGQLYGEGSQQYKDELEKCDEELGRLMQNLKDSGEYEKTIIYVTASNGFENASALSPYPHQNKYGKQGYTHRFGSYVFLATNDPAVQKHGLLIDIVPTILSRFFINPNQIYPVLPGKSLMNKQDKWVRMLY